MKVIRKKADAEGAAPTAAAPAAKPGGIKVVSRAPPPPAVSQEQIDSKKVAKLLERLTLGEHDAHCDGNNDIDAVVGAAGFASLQASGLLTKLKAEAEDTSNADGREAALLGFKQLCSSVGRPCEPYVVPLLPMMLERLADKVAPVREAAAQAAHAVVAILCPHAVELVLPGESRATGGGHSAQQRVRVCVGRGGVQESKNNCTVQQVGLCVCECYRRGDV
jgi:elongation factor 3